MLRFARVCASALDCCRMLMDPPKVAHGRGVLGRLEAVTAFLAWRRADKHAVEKKGRTRKSSPETCTSEYE
jgi:hypothetical protein